jgi:hypothetical protein
MEFPSVSLGGLVSSMFWDGRKAAHLEELTASFK